ncbi:MAG: hypothetical protein CBC48_12725 [bacterium TMED88]|nr:hypothetical protein [Deltaproteobacteria bacterium]OUV28725.1 MAG: hypothetical protein CBC48_12725 [bacterium TMED88]
MSTETAAPSARRSRDAALTVGALLVWLFLTPAEWAAWPPLRHAWAYNFWQYLPGFAGPTLAAIALSFALTRPRRLWIEFAQWLSASLRTLPAAVVQPAFFVLLTGALWLLREREITGDSLILSAAVNAGYAYIFPEVGATALGALGYRALAPLGFGVFPAAQFASCVFGATTALILTKACSRFGDGRSGLGAPLAALILSAGLLRVFAGHIEVYPAVLMFSSLYIWAAMGALDGRIGLWTAALALGFTIWSHVAALFLLPSLWVLCGLTLPSPSVIRWFRRSLGATVWAALPGSLFLLWALTLGPEADADRLLSKMLEIAGVEPAALPKSWWVRFTTDAPIPGVGLDYVFLSAAHFKYLANAFHVLAPAGLIILVVSLARTPREFLSPKSLFLGSAAAATGVYATLVRPFWGPFDWDLFAMTGLFFGALAAQVLASPPARRLFKEAVAIAIGFQLVYVGLPFVLLAAVETRPAGPFATDVFPTEFFRGAPPSPPLLPWL